MFGNLDQELWSIAHQWYYVATTAIVSKQLFCAFAG